MVDFNYAAPAEVFAYKTCGFGSSVLTYRRFDDSASAIRFMIEVLPSRLLPSAVLEANEHRFSAKQIRKLYDCDTYPYKRQQHS